MAQLRRDSDGHLQPLAHDALMGRSPEALVVLSSPRASSRHASLHWSGDSWEIRDLGSRNGTAVDGVRVPPGEPRTLAPGAVLELGSTQERWVLVDVSPPQLAARKLGSAELRVEEDGYLQLPSAEAPSHTVFEHPSLGWIVETEDGGLDAARHGQVLSTSDGAWTLHLSDTAATQATQDRPRLLSEATLRFTVSPDEEHVDVEAIWADATLALAPSVHWYTVLLLARARVEDAADPSAPEREHGWRYRDAFCQGLRTSPQKLNVDIHRLRRMLARAGIVDGATLVERRPSSVQIRLGVGAIELV